MGSVCVSLDILKKCNYRVAVSGVSGCARFLNRLSKKNINNLCAKIFFLTHTHTHTHTHLYASIVNNISEDIGCVFSGIYKCIAVIARRILFCRQFLQFVVSTVASSACIVEFK